MKTLKSSFPGISRQLNSEQAKGAIAESIELLTGTRGNGESRALLVKDLVGFDEMKRKALIKSVQNNNTGVVLPPGSGGGIEKPQVPVNVTGIGGFTFIAITWDHPTYKGHAYTEIYRSDTNAYANAVRIATEVTDIFSDSVNMGADYYYWVRFVNKADMVGPTQGANGIHVVTQQSAQQILNAISGQIEKTHLGVWLTTEVSKIPALALDIPPIKTALFDVNGVVETAKNNAIDAKNISEGMALNLVNSALIGDLNWHNNSTKLVDIESSLNGVISTVTQEFYTRTEANIAIAAAGTTLQVQIEQSLGITISGDLTNTYYTKASTDGAIAAADLLLKTSIEDPSGTSLGATLNNDYYTGVTTDSAIAAAGTTLKVQIEDPLGTSLGATLNNDYYTIVNTDSAISAANLSLISTIEDPNGSSIGATLQNSFYTKVDADQATANKITTLSSTFNALATNSIENSLANDLALDQQRIITADIIVEQKTIAEEKQALSQSLSSLTAEFNQSKSNVTEFNRSIANNVISSAESIKILSSSIDNVSADINKNFYTKVDADGAIAAADLLLKTSIEDPFGTSLGATLSNNYYTGVTTDSAIASATTQLKATIDNDLIILSADVYQKFYTKVDADGAVASADLALKVLIEDPLGSSIGADLQTNYYTKVTADNAIATANTLLQTSIEDINGNSLGASLQTLSSTVATNQGDFSAMWGVKTTVLGITASFGLVNDGVDPIFVIKGAKFAIINDLDPSVMTPVFSVVNGKTVISSAIIDTAYIKSLVTDDLFANRLIVGSSLSSPSVNYVPAIPKVTDLNGAVIIPAVPAKRTNNFSIDPAGNMEAKSAVLESATLKSVTITTAAGDIVLSASGELNGAWIKDLSVDSLKIKEQAVTVPSSVEINAVKVYYPNPINYTYSTGIYDGGGIQFSLSITAGRGTVANTSEALRIQVGIYTASNVQIKFYDFSVATPHAGVVSSGAACGMFSPSILTVHKGTSLYVKISLYVEGTLNTTVWTGTSVTGFISYAKR